MEEQINFYKAKLQYEIDAWDLSKKLGTSENLTIIDARSAQAFEQEHIPGAVSFPHRTMDIRTTKRLDKSNLYVTYCDGIGCNASTKAALKLAELGFSVKELLGGLDWWKRDGYKTSGVLASSCKDNNCGC